MLTMQPTLLVGPCDWHPLNMPKEEYLARWEALWRRLPAAGGAIVYGGRAHHAELAYLTGFTPKLESALALIPRAGMPQLLVGGGASMLQAARPLTFIEELRPLRNAGEAIARWANGLEGPPVLIGGAAMPYALREEIEAAMGGIEHRSTEIQALMRCKGPRELVAIRGACATLGVAMRAIADARDAGAGVTAAILAGEQACHRRSAQDVRTLHAVDGAISLRPLDTRVARAESLQVYLAVRHLGYWAEGFAVLPFASPHTAIAAHARNVLGSSLRLVQSGVRCSELVHAIMQSTGSMRLHPLSTGVLGNSIGIALEEQPMIAAEGNDRFETGDVVSLRLGLTDEDGRSAIVSAMLAIYGNANELLWSHAGVSP